MTLEGDSLLQYKTPYYNTSPFVYRLFTHVGDVCLETQVTALTATRTDCCLFQTLAA